MLNQEEYMLVQFTEEAAEVLLETQNALSRAIFNAQKVQRFGLHSVFYKDRGDNKDHLSKEILDLLATIEMLEEFGLVNLSNREDIIKAKKLKILKYMEISRNLKRLEPDNG